VDPDSPLGVPEIGEHQDVEPHLTCADGAYRKTAPVPLCGGILPVNSWVLFVASFEPIDAGESKVPAPEPPGTNWDGIGSAK